MQSVKNYITPVVIEKNLDGDEKIYNIYSRLLLDRIIFITDEIDDDMSNAICAQLLFLESQDETAPIKLYINSPGGSVTSGLAIYDTMNLVKCPIHTYCFGQAASMGAFLLAAGDKRYSLPNSRIMIHQPSTVVAGKASDIEISFNEIQTLKNVLNKILAKKTKKTLKEIEDATNDDNFMSAKEAKSYERKARRIQKIH